MMIIIIIIIITKKGSLKELTLANLVCIFCGWLALVYLYKIRINHQSLGHLDQTLSCSIPLQIGILFDAKVWNGAIFCCHRTRGNDAFHEKIQRERRWFQEPTSNGECVETDLHY